MVVVDVMLSAHDQIYMCVHDDFSTHPYTVLYRVESGSDDPDNLGHLGHFLEGQVGLIHKLNYLDVTRISHVL